MPIFKPSELHELLSQREFKARKSLSQNFLIDGNIVKKIIRTADVCATDLVIEIGPGPGALTEALLESGASVLAIEMDHFFSSLLSRFQTHDNRLTVVEADFLTFPLKHYLNAHLKKGQKAKVVANLPYHITTPILATLLPLHEHVSHLTLMVQKEVAKRFVAQKNTPDYSSFTLFLQCYGITSLSFLVNASCFYPKPSVDSAVVSIELIPPKISSEKFFQLTRTSFQQRRKMLRASLKNLYGSEKVEQALIGLGFLPTTRPEQLSLDAFIALFRFLENFSSDANN